MADGRWLPEACNHQAGEHTRQQPHAASMVGRPWTGTPALLRASDSERGAALVTVGPGGLVSLGCAALVFSDVSRFSSSLATTSLMAVRVGNDARGMPGNPHPAWLLDGR